MTTTSSRSKKRSSTKSRSRRRSSRRGGGMFLWIFLAVLVVLFGVLAFVSRSTGPAATEITDASVSGDALPAFTPGQDAAVGSPAPEITGETIDGEPIEIAPGDGTPKAIAFLAHWCPHCQREVPVVTQWVEDRGRRQHRRRAGLRAVELPVLGAGRRRR
jgi:thiol-disulfide isomerase/thioredoxin